MKVFSFVTLFSVVSVGFSVLYCICYYWICQSIYINYPCLLCVVPLPFLSLWLILLRLCILSGELLALRKKSFPIWVRWIATCRRELFAVTARLMFKSLWSEMDKVEKSRIGLCLPLLSRGLWKPRLKKRRIKNSA